MIPATPTPTPHALAAPVGIAPLPLLDVSEEVPAALASPPLGIAPPAAPPAAEPPGADKAVLLDAIIELEDISDIMAEPVAMEAEADAADMLPVVAEEMLTAAPLALETTLAPMPLTTADGAAIAPVLSALAKYIHESA